MGLVRLNTLQVNLLHGLEFHVGLGVASGASAELAESVILVQVELRSLQVLVDVFAKHLLEIISVSLSLLGVHLALAQVVQVGTAVASFRRLVSHTLRALRDLTSIHDTVLTVVRVTHELISLNSGWAGRWSALRLIVVVIMLVSSTLMESSHSGCQSLKLSAASWDVRRSLDSIHKALLVILDTLPSELTLGHTAVRISHPDLRTGRHQVLKITLLLLLCSLFGLFPRHLGVKMDIRLWLFTRPSLALLKLRFFNDGIDIVTLVKSLICHIVVGWRISHCTIN